MPADADSPARREWGPKGHHAGTDRLVSPDETLRRITPALRGLGITRVANITGLDVIGVPVVAVVRPNSRSISVSQGKGLDLAAAKVSGIMESLENYHAERMRHHLVLATSAEMSERAPVVDLASLPRIAGGALHPDIRILWVEGHEIFGRRAIWIPYEVVHTDYTLPLPPSSGALLMSDSGIAAGNHPLEATSHAVCELVERDAVTLWRFADERAQDACRVDLRTVKDESCGSIIARFERAGVEVAVWEVTSDVGIPAFFCAIIDGQPSGWRPLGPSAGSGCHPRREIALFRALSEAAQARLTVIAGARDDIGLATYERNRDRDLVDDTLARMKRAGPRRSFADGPSFQAPTFHEDVAWELERLREAGIEQVAVVDLTLPEIGIPVVRVVIPGLEGICDAPGFLAGKRLRARLS